MYVLLVSVPLLYLVHFSFALYPSGSDVIDLTDTNFDSKVTDSINVWVVEFYAPWCGHCQNFAPEYAKLASALKVRIASSLSVYVPRTQHN